MLKINNIIKKFGLKFGISINRITPLEKLQILINKLHPYTINKKLIRMGPNGNGGYLLPDDFDGIEACFSPGVGSTSDFEVDCAKMGMKVFLADNSVDGPTVKNKNFLFHKKNIGAIESQDFMTMDEWINNSDIKSDSDLLLQMDIEGYEYEVIYNISNDLMRRFRIIIIEFHQLEMLFNNTCFEKLSNVFEKIMQNHECVHIHPNNCCVPYRRQDIEIPPVMEFTFIRKDRIEVKEYSDKFPHVLDFDSAKGPTLILPKCWYSKNNRV